MSGFAPRGKKVAEAALSFHGYHGQARWRATSDERIDYSSLLAVHETWAGGDRTLLLKKK